MIGCCPCFWKCRASLAAEVVLPEPWSPTSMMTVGGCDAIARRCPEPPSSSTSSSRTTLTTCCPGVSDVSTSCPTALTRTRSMKPLTTLKLTSASRRATRTSRRVSWIFSSVSRPKPRSRSNIPDKRDVRLSSMASPCGNLQETLDHTHGGVKSQAYFNTSGAVALHARGPFTGPLLALRPISGAHLARRHRGLLHPALTLQRPAAKLAGTV